MKRYSLIILAFALLLGFTQCKPEPENNPDDSKMVTVRFELPINNGAKTDWNGFFQLNDDSTSFTSNIKWKEGDVVYLAVPNYKAPRWVSAANMIPLECTYTDDMSKVEFSAQVDEVSAWGIYDLDVKLYYFGSGEIMTFEKNTDGRIINTILDFSKQKGTRNGLADLHFSSVLVHGNFTEDVDGNILNLELVNSDDYSFSHEMAICYVNLQNETKLTGTAVSKNMVRVYCPEKSSTFVVEWFEGTEGGITLTETPSKESFIVIPPSDDAGMTLECDKGTYSFSNRIIANTIYYGKGVGNNKIEPLPWTPNP